MDNREELLSEEVRKYEHLYNPSMSEYKDTEMASNSWKEISANGQQLHLNQLLFVWLSGSSLQWLDLNICSMSHCTGFLVIPKAFVRFTTLTGDLQLFTNPPD
ncbi:unnamed protein product [Pleuronectes platessa]|uniref:MADF domain-containing protein n=1 Tax=Pleuronectes platessa TaxID=8262 RepID=A0A9N7TU90_PLEPL|nr:unnamed protein product [Pleuronectes platessa]